jgi:hypothetical protein
MEYPDPWIDDKKGRIKIGFCVCMFKYYVMNLIVTMRLLLKLVR